MLTPSEILFGGTGTVNTTSARAIAEAVGVDVSTVGRWKKDPNRIRYEDLRTIVRLRGLTDKQILHLFGRG